MPNTTLINSYYPVEYFADQNIAQVIPSSPNDFWASTEEYAPETEELIFDFGTERPVNFLDFEIAQKPIDISVFYDNNGTWVECIASEDFEPSMSFQYLPSLESSWAYFEYHFTTTTTRYMKIVFTRRSDPFPFIDSEQSRFSIDVRSLRLIYIVADYGDFIADTGSDILGNSYRTDAGNFSAQNILDEDPVLFWQSQPNPSPLAVEAVYFDVRLGLVEGIQSYLDELDQSQLSERSQADIEEYYSDGVLVDEVYIDPITTGPVMHIYFSLDDTPNWDNKLWTPVPRHYILRKGFHALPRPEYVKYIKLEFSRLAPAPYNHPEYPKLKPMTYRRYPSWVQNYFNGTYLARPNNTNFFDPYEQVEVDPLALGFRREIDQMNTGLELRQPSSLVDTDTEIKTFIQDLVSTQQVDPEPQSIVEDEIQFNTSWMWQMDLINQMDNTRSLTRFVQHIDSGFTAEMVPITEPPPTIQSVSNLSIAQEEKEIPIMWFPVKCRHAYQVIKAERPAKVAYFVALRDVQFHRRDYAADFDEAYYVETFDDDYHTDVNDFSLDGWRYVVGEVTEDEE